MEHLPVQLWFIIPNLENVIVFSVYRFDIILQMNIITSNIRNISFEREKMNLVIAVASEMKDFIGNIIY